MRPILAVLFSCLATVGCGSVEQVAHENGPANAADQKSSTENRAAGQVAANIDDFIDDGMPLQDAMDRLKAANVEIKPAPLQLMSATGATKLEQFIVMSPKSSDGFMLFAQQDKGASVSTVASMYWRTDWVGRRRKSDPPKDAVYLNRISIEDLAQFQQTGIRPQ